MATFNKIEKKQLLRMLLIHLVPLFGILFLQWEIFDVAFVYIVELCAGYLVYEIDTYFIDKKTRFPFIAALFQFAITLMPLAGLLIAPSYILFVLFKPTTYYENIFENDFLPRIINWQQLVALLYFMFLEFIGYYQRKKKDVNHEFNSYWRIFRRVLFTQIYLCVGFYLVALFQFNIYFSLLFIIGFKLMLDYSFENKKLYDILFLNFLRKPVEQKKNRRKNNFYSKKGYLLEKSTYRRRRK